MKRRRLALCLLSALLLLSGCDGRELQDNFFPISMALDVAEGGQLRISLKALTGSTNSPSVGDSPESAQDETAYVTIEAMGKDYLQAMTLLITTVPRALNLSQLREIVISRKLAESDAFAQVLTNTSKYYQINEEALLVVCEGEAQEIIRVQRSFIGLRLSRYLDVLLTSFEDQGTIARSTLRSTRRALRSTVYDPLAIYAAYNNFDTIVPLPEEDTLAVLPGNLPRKSTDAVEYMGSAVFSGSKMVGTLTGQEMQMLHIVKGDYTKLNVSLEGEVYVVERRFGSKISVKRDGGKDTLYSKICVIASTLDPASHVDADVFADAIAKEAYLLIEKLQSMGADAIGFGQSAVKGFLTTSKWEAYGWLTRYPMCAIDIDVEVSAPKL